MNLNAQVEIHFNKKEMLSKSSPQRGKVEQQRDTDAFQPAAQVQLEKTEVEQNVGATGQGGHPAGVVSGWSFM